MTIRKRTILTIIGSTCTIVLVGVIFTQTSFLDSYKELETLDIESDAIHMMRSLEGELDDLSALTNDWAAWDDTYQFIQDKNQEYIASNLVDGTFESLSVSLIVLYDPDGRVVFQKAYDLENQEEILPPISILDNFKGNSDFYFTNEEKQNSGFFFNEDTPIIYAINPILTSMDEGPARGFLLFVKNIDGERFSRLNDITNSTVTILPYSDTNLPSDGVFFPIEDYPDSGVIIRKIDNSRIEYFTVIPDLFGDPAFIIKQQKDRIIYQQGMESMRSLLWSILLTSFIAGLITISSLEINLISRLSSLHSALKKYRKEKRGIEKIRLPGKDELSSLSIEIDQTLQSLTNAQNKLNENLKYEKMLVEISTKFINLSVRKIDENIQQVLETIGKYAGIDRNHIVIFQKGTYTIDYFYEWHKEGITSFNKTDFIGLNIKNFKWICSNLNNDKLIAITDPSNLPEIAKKERILLLNNKITSVLCAVLKIRGEIIGLMTFEIINRERDFNDQIPPFLELTANIIANAIDRKRNEEHLRLGRQFQYSLNQITKTSIEKESYSSSIRTLSKQLRSLINSDRGWLILIDRDKSYKVYDSGKRIKVDQKISESIDFLLDKTTKDIFIHNSNLKNKSLNLDSIGKSFIAIPLFAKNQHLGLVILLKEEDHVFSSLEIGICQQAGSQITLAIIKIRALEDAQQVSKELRDLRETIVDISSELKLEKLLKTILTRAIKLMNAEGGEFYIYDDETQELETVASFNMAKDFKGKRIKVGEGAAGIAVKRRKIFSIKDYSTWSKRIPDYEETHIKASITTPLMVGDRILGCIGVCHYSSDYQFTKNDHHLLTIFAQHASIAIDNAMLFQKTQELAYLDEVTGLINRRALNEIGQYEVARSVRLNRPIAVAMIDLDNYKQVNDLHSHLTGDKVLKEISRLFRENVRNIDIIGRYGGDECVIIMPETDEENARLAVERIRNVLENTVIKVENLEFEITACFGISSYEENPPSLEKMIAEADTAMYAAKEAGRNCIRVFKGL